MLRVKWQSIVTELIIPNKTTVNVGQNIKKKKKKLSEGTAE